MNKLIVYYNPECLLKYNGINHPENKKRLEVVIDSIKKLNNIKIDIRNAPLANMDNISLVHPINHINSMFSIIPKSGLIGLENEPNADTFLCPDSKNAILRSCGAGIAAADDIFSESNNIYFCAIRPPGHHAETMRANGFCFINNAAVAARYLQKKYKIKRIGIIDFDVHHGNGTQEIFYSDKNVFYGSIHEYPLFPWTGLSKEVGVGNIFNAPIEFGTKGNEFIQIFDKKILDNLDKFKPQIILISAGFDAHKRDPLAHINLESSDYYILSKKISELAKIHCDGKIISFLEGGYDLIALQESVLEYFRGLTE